MRGFTLIELLIVIGVMAVLGFIFTNTLVQTLRGQNKARIISQVKQNGQVILDKLSSEIRQSEKVVCVGDNSGTMGSDEPSTDSIADTIVVFKQGTYTRFRFYPEMPEVGPTRNGFIVQNIFTGSDIPNGTTDELLCTNPAGLSLGQTNYLTDTDVKNGASVSYDNVEPFFNWIRQAGYNDIVTIKFRIFQAVNSGGVYESAVGSDGILFTTSVQVRGGK